ncbi:CHAT domain-containing protein [Amycolatopsis japonica]|uniref:CHAT domain-containing protein n=1 Tax=Amycolatopsis japonica TaxID=208439 RepID=UPI0036731138
MVASRADDVDIRFLRVLATDDEVFRAAAERAAETLEQVSPHVQADRSAASPEPLPFVVEIITTFLQPAGFPADLSPLRELSVVDGEDLLTTLLEILAGQPHTAATFRVRRSGTDRLRRVVAALTHDGARAVTARLLSPAAIVTSTDQVWTGGLLSLVRPRDVLVAVRRATEHRAHRVNVLRWLSEVGETLGDAHLVPPGTPGAEPPLVKIFKKAYPVSLPKRGEELRIGSGRAVPVGDTVRTVHPLLDCPESVDPGRAFDLRVGLSPEIDRTLATAGPFRVASDAFTLTITLFHDGFTLIGESSTATIEVTPERPYPAITMHMAADDDPTFLRLRTITAVFAANGIPIGTASRQIRVTGRDGQAQDHSAGSTRPGDWSFDPAGSRADVELYLLRGGDRAARRWLWHVRSPHARIPDTEDALLVGLDESTAEAMQRFIRGIEQREGRSHLELYLNGVAGHIGELVHDRVWDALRTAADVAGGPPTVLLVTEDAYIPWELARVPMPWTPDRPWLGAQAVLGRWPYLGHRSAPAPPAAFDAARMAIVFGTYPDGIALPAAEAEGKSLKAKYSAAEVLPTIETILAALDGEVPADVLHVALHGNFDAAGDEDGLMMIDGEEYLTPEDVGGVETSPVRLVFLNACQVAQGRQVFGTYAGMAAALVKIGIGGLIAPLWKIDDTVAARIADNFYSDVFAATETPASFLRRRRCGGVGGESTQFAYVFFGHPRLAITWKGVGSHGEVFPR